MGIKIVYDFCREKNKGIFKKRVKNTVKSYLKYTLLINNNLKLTLMTYFFVFIWLGSLLPEQYQQTIADCNSHPQNSCILLNDTHWQQYFEKYKDLLDLTQEKLNSLVPVERSDILRLLYLYEKGGIYSDLDNIINYDCLYDFLEGKPDFFFGQEQWRKQNIFPSNFFIYSAKPKFPELRYLISKIKDCANCSVLDFAGPQMLYKYNANFLKVRKCILHLYHGKWVLPQPKKYYVLFIFMIIIVILSLLIIVVLKWRKKQEQNAPKQEMVKDTDGSVIQTKI